MHCMQDNRRYVLHHSVFWQLFSNKLKHDTQDDKAILKVQYAMVETRVVKYCGLVG